MARRKVPLVSGEIYHVFNRSIAQQHVFRTKWELNRLLQLLDYYRFSENPVRFSHFFRLPKNDKLEIMSNLYKTGVPYVEIYCLVIMSNHFHLLVKQSLDDGIKTFIGNMQNSYAKYLNIRTNRTGALFQSPFKAVRIENDYQFLHVSRYIHLNPLTSHVLDSLDDLKSYPWSSYFDYLADESRPLINTNLLMGLMKTKERLSKFTLDQADYQHKIERVKHLTIDG